MRDSEGRGDLGTMVKVWVYRTKVNTYSSYAWSSISSSKRNILSSSVLC